LITSLILFTPDFCNAQTVEKYNTDNPTIRYLKGKLAYLNEELEALHKDLEYVMLMTDSKDSKKEVQKDIERLMAQVQQSIEEIMEQLDSIVKTDENGS